MKSHISYVCEKAQKTAKALSTLLPNIKGPGDKKRVVLTMAVQSIVLYAAPVWTNEEGTQRHKVDLLKAQRIMALRVCRAYRTASTDAVLVLAGLVPLNLMAEERKRLFELSASLNEDERRRERSVTMGKWQEGWDSSQRGRWTYQLVPRLSVWLERGHGEVSFRMAQCMTGHGVFYRFLKKNRQSSISQLYIL
jgi:hypothetical protein